MIRRWLLYAAALAGALALRVFYTGWLAGLILAAVACLPLLGVLTTLPAVLSCRLALSCEREQVPRGDPASWVLTGSSLLKLPLGRVRIRLESLDRMTGQTDKKSKTWSLPGSGGRLRLAVPTDHCGLLTARLTSAWALDALGLFWLPLLKAGEASLWVLPIPRTTGLPPLPEEARPGVRPKPGGGPGEDYDPRPYRPGDPLNAIHWKLSAKRDELVTRETLETLRPLPLLTLDCFGPPETLDALLDLLAGTSAALLEAGRPHAVAWAHPLTGELYRFSVACPEDWGRCLQALLSQRAPLTGLSVLDAPDLGKSLHLTAGGGEAQ